MSFNARWVKDCVFTDSECLFVHKFLETTDCLSVLGFERKPFCKHLNVFFCLLVSSVNASHYAKSKSFFGADSWTVCQVASDLRIQSGLHNLAVKWRQDHSDIQL